MNYHNITKDDMLNGEGLRVVLWLSGCSHKCKGCHNPITWDCYGGIVFDENAKNEIFEQLEKDYISGITFSGGDPLHENNIVEVFELIKEIKQKYPTKNIWLYSGYTYENLEKSNLQEDSLRLTIVKHCDVFCDGEFIEELKEKKLEWVGSSNQKVIRMKDILKKEF